ncbi:MAG: DUF4011 domain-containing protein [Tannerellaceae bacterium]|jgi:superfamily I DNA and/or RNA helicase/very-short-patch-repair endonuclease|nr:DUF4011 domain-containing protein [Tannerellaceae bacterium]
MNNSLRLKIETWKKLLLDLGKRNRLINFKETRHSNIVITAPSFEHLYDLIVIKEKVLSFPFAKKISLNDEGEETYEEIVKGDVETPQSLGELQKTLKILRSQSRLSVEEQGINTLYLTFGLLKWKEIEHSSFEIISPIILVPVRLVIESLLSPYKMELHEDEIVVNPTLVYRLENDFGIRLPSFDGGDTSIGDYFVKVDKVIKNKNWELRRNVNLTLLSFLKINMYKDLERNEGKLRSHPIIQSIVGDKDGVAITKDYNNYDHDANIRPIDVYQVVDADSSQMDAILLSKNGESFVLQGPPGTGKSQTITNIISEGLADGKKILFVSEKMAALQVVHKRLYQVGLSDFCLILHSHRANKKEILQDLSNSMSQHKTRVREDIISQLDTLEKKRNVLNEYPKELHTKYQPVGWSIFDVNGKLAKLNHIPNIIFTINNVKAWRQSELNEKISILTDFARTIGKKSEDYTANPWRNAVVTTVTNELRHDIDANLSVLNPILNDLYKHHEDCCSHFGLDYEPTKNNCEKVRSILSYAGKCPLIPTKWLLSDDIEALCSDAVKYKNITDIINNKKEALLYSYNSQLLTLPGREIQQLFTELSTKIISLLNPESFIDNEVIINNLTLIAKEANHLYDYLSRMYEPICKLCETLELEKPTDYGSLAQTVDILKCLSVNIPTTYYWYYKNTLSMLKKKADEYAKISDELKSLKFQIDKDFDKDIYSINLDVFLKRFRSEYNSIFRNFKSTYRSDVQYLRGFVTNGNKIEYRDWLSILNKLKIVKNCNETIKNSESELVDLFGKNYKGINTEWGGIIEQIDIFYKLFNLLKGERLPKKFIELYAMSKIPYYTISEVLQHFKVFKKDFFNEKATYLLHVDITESNFPDLLIRLKSLCEDSKSLHIVYANITNKLKLKRDYNSIVEDIHDLVILQESEKQMIEQKSILEKSFDFYWKENATDWDSLIDALAYTAKFRTLKEQEKLPINFVEIICSDDKFIEKAKLASETYDVLLAKAERFYKWVESLFDSMEKLSDTNMGKLIERLYDCVNRKMLLEEWVDYRNNRKKCKDAGLSEYIDQVEQKNIGTDYIVDSFLKRFYRLWLDAVMPEFPAVQSFRSRIHVQTIADFKILDTCQQKIAQLRIRERILQRLPNFNSITAPRDEIGILKRELNKQRRIMPLRKLFSEIPNLLPTLRPCFMMSPLSVSVFLEAQSYEFDMIIFDEASQVHTEDAIGAIMRGKQIIIVGDNKQLPPTNFFSTTLNDVGDFDNDEEEDPEIGAYESILDEALKALPEQSLLWHYRSKHEHLIAFSNYKIYNKRLITFPSCSNKAEDVGVEYIYVENGRYDRGGKRNNVVEAAKVGDMVFDHFKKYPKRSLGIVTFSGAQQHAVEAAITKRRIQDRRFERFFDEEIEEPFFIKNLENVQGDERDSIIFSIGYAKDGTGREMAMNLGPLGKNGGERRLNVAITRAKYNVKLVGSIQPSDLDLERTNAAGVKLLRSYIEFAQQGISAIHHEINIPTNGESEPLGPTFDSPFEEAVYDYLISQGYDVDTQVGCSGYRIDMAVRHRLKTNIYILGIECDGATYHTSRTARERDRLRQEVLEKMGWKIYRIWSTDWIKDPVSEGEKMKTVIEAILNHKSESIEESSKDFQTIEPSDEFIISDDNTGSFSDFAIYEEADICNIKQLYNEQDDDYTSRLIKYIITIEQPVHYDLLCKRIAPIFGRQKASSVVRESVDFIIQKKLNNEFIVNDNFYQLKSMSEINIRTSKGYEGSRTIQYISNDEICEAMLVVASKSYGIKRDDIMTATARALGYEKNGANIITAMTKAYMTLINCEKIKEIEGKIILT